MTKLDIVIPILNEQENIPIIYEQIRSLELSYDWKVVFVDDGSEDSSLNVIEGLSKSDQRVKGISLSRNFGHQIALSAGIDWSHADCVIMLDGDLQHPPELIPEMLSKYEQGYDVVQMVKKDQGKRTLSQKVVSCLFYRVFSRISGVKVSPNISDFRLVSRRVADVIRILPEKERFLRGLVQWVGFKYIEIKYTVGERKFGVSKYNMIALAKLASYGIFSFSSFPLRLAFYVGLALSGLSFLYGAFAVFKRLTAPNLVPVGYTDLMVMICFLGGMQLIFIGVIGAYLSKVLDQVKNRPLYLIDRTF